MINRNEKKIKIVATKVVANFCLKIDCNPNRLCKFVLVQTADQKKRVDKSPCLKFS